MWITANFQDNREDIMNICVYGAASARLEEIYYKKTQELGALMGKQGHGLVFGGGATGMMGAAARGVHSENGYILGIAPRFFDQPGVLYEHCTEFIFTETMREREMNYIYLRKTETKRFCRKRGHFFRMNDVKYPDNYSSDKIIFPLLVTTAW